VDPALVVALVVATVGPLIAYLGASRKLSGKIGTSEASDLWAESSRIRDDYRERLDKSNVRQAELEARVAKCEGENNSLMRDNIALRARVETLERENANLRSHVEKLLEQLLTAEED
jgi:chromosome segregation ATPase